MSEQIILPKISQSLIKALYSYFYDQSECGHYIKERYIKKNPLADKEPTEAMQLGIYFEYKATGALPRDGKIPEPKIVYKGTAREAIAEPYKRAEESAKLFKEIIKHYGIKIISIGKRLETKDGENGILDIEAEWNGKPCIIDLKYSGMFDDEWNDSGWGIKRLGSKQKLMLQGAQYKYLAEKCMNIHDIDFYFMVFDSKDSTNVKIVKEIVSEDQMNGHIALLNKVKSVLIQTIKDDNFMKPLPHLKRCKDCPLFETCPYAAKFPTIEEVYYGEMV